ncbi:MAG: ribonuclease R [Bacteroidaceae bacterium]
MGNSNKMPSRSTKRQMVGLLMNLFESNPQEEYSLSEIAKELKLKTHPSKLLCTDILDDLTADDFISITRNHTYRLTTRNQLMEGVFQRKRNGRNSFLPDGEDKGILVMERNSHHALNGDRVKATLLARRRNHTREAEVIEIVKRVHDSIVGVLKVEKSYAFLLTHDRTLAADIFIPKSSLKHGKTGDKALVQIVDWPDDQKNPVGMVVDILGKAGENDTEMHAILAEYDLPYVYPKIVEAAAEKIQDDITPEEIARREDFRQVTTFTIDPHDAKDFDDALSIRPIDNGLWEVGVHIADVTHYLKEDGIIDKEAFKRSTSVYLVDRTVPMLPERLCNFLCSLRPHEEKLTYSVIFKISDSGEVKGSHIARTVICSDRRFAYEEVQSILEQNGEASPEDLAQPGEHPQRVKPNPDGSPVGEYAKELITLNRLAKCFRQERFSKGGIDFNSPEVRFDIDEKGHPVSTYVKVAKDANKLVEEFMLLANKYVAEEIGKVAKGKKSKTFVYRIHDVPDPEKLEKLSAFVSKFGYKLRTEGSKDDINKGLNKLLAEVHDKPEQEVVGQVALRSMMKARYSTHNIGHYGLMFRYYTHFTSPIRRYPDQMVHRLLTRYAEGGRSVNQEKTEELCDHCNEMELTAAMAERASIKYKQVEFMGDRLGQIFNGKISGVNEFGIYVELDDNSCEGMVPISNLQDDYYEFDERNYCLLGRRTHHHYQLGDRVTIRVAQANLERRQLDFELVDGSVKNK